MRLIAGCVNRKVLILLYLTLSQPGLFHHHFLLHSQVYQQARSIYQKGSGQIFSNNVNLCIRLSLQAVRQTFYILLIAKRVKRQPRLILLLVRYTCSQIGEEINSPVDARMQKPAPVIRKQTLSRAAVWIKPWSANSSCDVNDLYRAQPGFGIQFHELNTTRRAGNTCMNQFLML